MSNTCDPQAWQRCLHKLETVLDLAHSWLSPATQAASLPHAATLEQVWAFRWHSSLGGNLEPIYHADLPQTSDLLGIEPQLQRLRRNTAQFVRAYPANHALLWGDRGTGKSTAIRSLLPEFAPQGLRLIEVQAGQLAQLPRICELIRQLDYPCILYCDDLAFNQDDAGYRQLKALLDGGLEAQPANMLLYATSNRRHLLPEATQDTQQQQELHPQEAIAEQLSLTERFGLSLGFYAPDMATYIRICQHWAQRYSIDMPAEQVAQRARQWAQSRGHRSGRIARQFITDLQGKLALQEEDAGLSRS